MSLKSFLNCIFSPRLIQIYNTPGRERNNYEPYRLEKLGDQIINSIYIIWKLGVYTSPFWSLVAYNRGYFEPHSLGCLTKCVAGVGVILIVSFCVRGLSRAQNSTYLKFLEVLQRANVNISETKQELMHYDFDFKAWPVEFDLSKSATQRVVKTASTPQSTFDYLLSLPCRVVAYAAVHSFGIRLIYPGSVALLQAILDKALLEGRTRLVDVYHGERFKLKTADGNSIDTMLINRQNNYPNGKTLVVCCEGNAGFYEIGTMVTPIEAGYSVIGWNHPGFAGSTGMPYPSQEQNAIDAVIQFAITKLGFQLENIILFGWSIGGYTASWAAMTYPEIKGVVIDATFDDIMPLALNHMPRWWEPIVRLAVREHVNLNVSEQLAKYIGPLLLIRRTKDEVICIQEGVLSTNRGNHLLVKTLLKRYPCIFESNQLELLQSYLAVTGIEQERILTKYSVEDQTCYALLQSYVSENSKNFPMKIGETFNVAEKNQMALYLAKKYMKDFKASHCVSLPWDMFTTPFDVTVESDFVFT